MKQYFWQKRTRNCQKQNQNGNREHNRSIETHDESCWSNVFQASKPH